MRNLPGRVKRFSHRWLVGWRFGVFADREHCLSKQVIQRLPKTLGLTPLTAHFGLGVCGFCYSVAYGRISADMLLVCIR